MGNGESAVVKGQPREGDVRGGPDRSGWLLTGASAFGAVLASACCIVPLALFSLGIGGAWIANLTALEPYKPFFVVATFGFLAAGFLSVHRRRRRACSVDGYCASSLSTWVITGMLAASTVLVIAVLAWPYLVPILLAD